jgi:hypothetical protein
MMISCEFLRNSGIRGFGVSRSQGSRTREVQNFKDILAVCWKVGTWYKINNSGICDSKNQRRDLFKTPKVEAPKSRSKTHIKVHVILSDVIEDHDKPEHVIEHVSRTRQHGHVAQSDSDKCQVEIDI